MKKSETNKIKHPSLEEVNKDLDIVLNILKEINTTELDTDIDIDKFSKNINDKLESINKKYEDLTNDLDDDKQN